MALVICRLVSVVDLHFDVFSPFSGYLAAFRYLWRPREASYRISLDVSHLEHYCASGSEFGEDYAADNHADLSDQEMVSVQCGVLRVWIGLSR